MNEELFVNEFISKLDGKLSIEDLRIVSRELQVFASNYNIDNKSTELINYPSAISQYYQVYMVSKKIEGLSNASLKTYDYYLKDFFFNINKSLTELNTNDIRIYLYDLQKGEIYQIVPLIVEDSLLIHF